MNGYKTRLLREDERRVERCCEDGCEAQATTMCWSLENKPAVLLFCGQHLVERACAWGCVTLDEAAGPHELKEVRP